MARSLSVETFGKRSHAELVRPVLSNKDISGKFYFSYDHFSDPRIRWAYEDAEDIIYERKEEKDSP